MAMIQGDIQRLSQGPRLKGKLGAARERDPIPGKVTPFAEDTFAVASTAPAAASSAELDCNVNDNETEKQENDEVTDPNDPNTFHKGGAGGGSDSQEETGMQDIDSAMNDETGNDTQGSDYSTDPKPSTKGFTNLTDENGDCFNVRMDGTFPTPEGWNDPDTPPVPEPPEGYEEGFFWYRGTNGRSSSAPDPVSVYEQLVDAASGQEWVSGSVVSISGGGNTATVQYTVRFVPAGNESTFTDTAIRDICDNYSGESAVDAACAWTPEDDVPESWPEGECYVLAYKDGTFQTNQFDPSAPENWEPKSTVYSYEGGVPKYGMTGTANGGYMVYDTNSDKTPNSSGTAKVYDSQGRFTAAGNPTSQFMDQYLPK